MKTPNAGMNAEKLDHAYIAGGNVECYSHSGWHFVSFLKIKQETTIWTNNYVIEHLSQKKEVRIEQKVCEVSGEEGVDYHLAE